MSSLKSGPQSTVDRTVNSVGNCHFGKWHLQQTTIKEDLWRKPEVNDEQGIIVADSYIQIRRVNHSKEERDYRIWFSGNCHWLREHFKRFYPEYQDHDTAFKFDDIRAAKDYIDRFIERLDKLKAFL